MSAAWDRPQLESWNTRVGDTDGGVSVGAGVGEKVSIGTVGASVLGATVGRALNSPQLAGSEN